MKLFSWHSGILFVALTCLLGTSDGQVSSPEATPAKHLNKYADFYCSIRDQVMEHWKSPSLSDSTTISPIVRIHVERDGSVPPWLVKLIQSSGNASYDNSALAAAKNLVQLHEPLPDGCPPDIPITFKLTR